MTTSPIQQVSAQTAAAPASPAAAQPAAQAAAGPVRHEFVIRDFATESGAVLPEARVVYGTTGTLNAARDNAVLLPSHYMADMHGYEWLIGPGRALDPNRAVPGVQRDLRQWALVFAEQHARTAAWAPLSGDDHSRQRRGGVSAADRGAWGRGICGP